MIKSLCSLSAFVLGVVTLLGVASAQNVRLKDMKLSVGDQLTPQYSVGGVKDKPSDPQNWIELEATFSIEVADRSGWVDSVSIRWYLGMVDQENAAMVLPVEVKYLDVPAGDDVHASVYVAPRNIQRITGERRVMANRITKWAAVILDANGTILGAVDEKGQHGPDEIGDLWFSRNDLARRDGIVRPRNQTPFAPLWSDYYLEEAVGNNR